MAVFSSYVSTCFGAGRDSGPQTTTLLSNWMSQHIWPQIHSMMLNDAYYKLLCHARTLASAPTGPMAALIEVGYVTSQTLAIRRLCDGRRDVISLRRCLTEANTKEHQKASAINQLIIRLNDCEHVCELVNNYLAHTGNPVRRANMSTWDLQLVHLTEAQQAVCETAISFDRYVLCRSNYIAVIPVPQFDIMQELRSWVPANVIQQLWDFWHTHNAAVNKWAGV